MRLGLLLLSFLLLACGGAAATPTPAINAAATQTRAIELAQLATLSAPTATPAATATPTMAPTATAVPPTSTPPPTNTPAPPTATREPPTPTATRVPPTPTSAPPPAVPQELRGGGAQAPPPIQLNAGLTLIRSRHGGRRNFIVQLLDRDARTVDLVANEIEVYDGTKALRVPARGSTFSMSRPTGSG